MSIDFDKLEKSLKDNDPSDPNYSIFFDSMARDILALKNSEDYISPIDNYTLNDILVFLTNTYMQDLELMLKDYEVK